MTEESHRDAMNHAIRAQRERGNVPKSMLPPEDEPRATPPSPESTGRPEPAPAPEPEQKSFFARLLGR